MIGRRGNNTNVRETWVATSSHFSFEEEGGSATKDGILSVTTEGVNTAPPTTAHFQRLRTRTHARTFPSRSVLIFSAWLKVARLKLCVWSIVCVHLQKVIRSHSDVHPSLA